MTRKSPGRLNAPAEIECGVRCEASDQNGQGDKIRIAFSAEVKCAPVPFGFSSWRTKTVNLRTAIFRQINKDKPRMHHDALEFPDGTCVLLTDLREGQEATVLQLPAQPKTLAEEAAHRRVTYIG